VKDFGDAVGDTGAVISQTTTTLLADAQRIYNQINAASLPERMMDRYGIDISSMSTEQWSQMYTSFMSDVTASGESTYDYLGNLGISDPNQFLADFNMIGSWLMGQSAGVASAPSSLTAPEIAQQLVDFGIIDSTKMLDTSSIDNLMESAGELDGEFGALIDAVAAVPGALDSLLTSLAQDTSQYFGSLQSLDTMIADAGGIDYRGPDAQWEADTYKVLFENAIEAGLPSVADIGLQYAQSLVKLAPYTRGGFDLDGLLAGIREDIVGMKSPEDFYTSIQDSIESFATETNNALAGLVKNIGDLHPQLYMDNVHVSLTVVHDTPSGTTTVDVSGTDGEVGDDEKRVAYK